MKLKELIAKNNQNADFVGNYDKNKELRKKLFLIGSPLTITGFVIALTAFILIGIFGSNLQSIKNNTGLLISMFFLLVLFSVMFGFGLYILREASFLHLKKEELEIIETKKENKKAE